MAGIADLFAALDTRKGDFMGHGPLAYNGQPVAKYGDPPNLPLRGMAPRDGLWPQGSVAMDVSRAVRPGLQDE